MNYSTIQPPFTLVFREMAKKDLIAYREWFHDSSPTRIAGLASAVTATPGYESWQPDSTPDSLEQLGRWFEGQVETQTKEPAEIARAESEFTFPIELPKEELTTRTFSLAMDIGMYFAQVILKNLHGTRWDQPLTNKKFADYGQPVLMGFGTVPLNPVRVMVTTAYAISKNRPAQLRELYETWARMKR